MNKIKTDPNFIEMCRLYLASKNLTEYVDPVTIYQLNLAFQNCIYHGGHHHHDCIYFDTMKMNVFYVDGECGNVHANSIDRIDEKFSQNLSFSENIAVSEDFIENESIINGEAFNKGTYYWYFCNKCIDKEQVISEIQLPNWASNLVRKYSYIWIDWNLR